MHADFPTFKGCPWDKGLVVSDLIGRWSLEAQSENDKMGREETEPQRRRIWG